MALSKKERNHRYYLKHKEEIQELKHRYYLEHQEEIKKKGREYYAKRVKPKILGRPILPQKPFSALFIGVEND
ncbi:hypothetical protein [Parasutterella excrementihominis]|uniref:hypothetical protein n=1 Tax=Parasutterella excrementihominis TaxID=487175 RepID=UPI003A8DA95A